MDLLYITDVVCDSCGAMAVAETKGGQDESGSPYETRTFKCGHIMVYSSQSRYPVSTVPCPKSSEETERQILRNTAKRLASHYIGNMNVDDVWKNNILNHIHYS